MIPPISKQSNERGRPKGRAPGTSNKSKKSRGPLGELVRKYRLEKQMGLAEVSKACQCSVQFISNIEHGRAPLPWDKAQRLCKVLNIPQGELEAANLATRSDFQSFLGKRSKSENWQSVASWMSLAKVDADLRALLELYESMDPSERKQLVKRCQPTLG